MIPPPTPTLLSFLSLLFGAKSARLLLDLAARVRAAAAAPRNGRAARKARAPGPPRTPGVREGARRRAN
jgi:hypothetical protein